MTENPWPSGGSPATPPPGTVGQEAPSRTDIAKEEAAGVAQQAAGSARDVAETGKVEAAAVAREVKANARDLLHQAKSDLTSQAGTQQQKAAEGIRNISSQLQAMADAPDQQGVASDLVRQAAERSSSVASWLEARDPGSLLDEVKSFARRRPGTFLLMAAGAGLLAGRVTRSVAAEASASKQSSTAAGTAGGPAAFAGAPPWPARRPVETVIAAGTGDHFFDEPVAVGGTVPSTEEDLPGSAGSGIPTREDTDPFPPERGQIR